MTNLKRSIAWIALVLALGCCGGAMQSSRAYTRYQVAHGVLPAPEEVRLNEFLAAYPETLPDPSPHAAGLTVEGARAAFADENEEPLVVVQTAVRGRNPNTRPPMALMIVVDRSGSMAEADKMTFVRDALSRLSAQLDPSDTLGIVAFDDAAEILLPLTTVGEAQHIRAAIDRLAPRGSTNLAAGLDLGYAVLSHAPRNYLRRVVLLTDAQANVGETDLNRIASWAAAGDEAGIRLSCVGVGLASRDDVLTEMSRRGHGNHYFLDSGAEIRRVFEQEIAGLLEDVADQVRLTFEPAPGMSVVRVEGGDASPSGNSWQVDLGRLGATEHRIVLWTLRGVPTDDHSPQVGRFALDFVDMRSHEPMQALNSAPVFLVHDAAEGTVARNSAVAWMVRDLHEVSAMARQGRYAEAQARLDRTRAVMGAVSSSRPGDTEMDHDRQTLDDWARTLAGYTGRAVTPIRARITVRYE